MNFIRSLDVEKPSDSRTMTGFSVISMPWHQNCLIGYPEGRLKAYLGRTAHTGRQAIQIVEVSYTVVERGANEIYRIPEETWNQIRPLLPPELPKPRGGRPRMDNRKAMAAILYAFRVGCKWNALPGSLGAPSTVRKRFQEWRKTGVFQRMWRTGILTYDEMRAMVWYGKPGAELQNVSVSNGL